MDNKALQQRSLLRILFSALIFTVTYVIVWRMYTNYGGYGDYVAHAELADRITLSGFGEYAVAHPYFLWHLLVKIVHILLPMEHAVAFVSAAANLAAFLGLEAAMHRYGIHVSAVAAFCALIVGPLYAPWYNPNYYQGQMGPIEWHNPTNMMAKPFAIICFFIIVGFLQRIHRGEKIPAREYFALSVLLLLSVLAKPSFAQAIIPGLGLYMVLRCLMDRFKHFIPYVFICLTFVPAVLDMTYQTWVYWGQDEGNSIAIGWMKVYANITPNPWISFIILPFLFPLLYIALNWKKALAATDIQLALCYELAGWLEATLLYENGPSMTDGNFCWGGRLSAIVLWAVVLANFVRDVQHIDLKDRKLLVKNLLLGLALIPHILCGAWWACGLFTGGWGYT